MFINEYTNLYACFIHVTVHAHVYTYVYTHVYTQAYVHQVEDLMVEAVYGNVHPPAVKIEGTACLCSAWISDANVVCTAPPGKGNLLALTLTHYGQVGVSGTVVDFKHEGLFAQ